MSELFSAISLQNGVYSLWFPHFLCNLSELSVLLEGGSQSIFPLPWRFEKGVYFRPGSEIFSIPGFFIKNNGVSLTC
ncbi:hypothetical protein ACDI96_23110 [Citrobacter telavivensis]